MAKNRLESDGFFQKGRKLAHVVAQVVAQVVAHVVAHVVAQLSFDWRIPEKSVVRESRAGRSCPSLRRWDANGFKKGRFLPLLCGHGGRSESPEIVRR